MSLKSERIKQYVTFKTGVPEPELENIMHEEKEHSDTNLTMQMSTKRKRQKKIEIKSVLLVLKNFVCFTGIWILPFLHIAGLDVQKFGLIYLGVIAAVSFGNLNLLTLGKKHFDMWDLFTILDLTESTWRYEELQQKNPPLIEKLHLNSGGVFFGKKDGVEIGKNVEEDGHVVVFGGSGSGKSSCFAIPTLNRYEQGAFIIDIKDGGELERKSTYQGKSYVFRPGDRNSLGYDPFWFIDKKEPEAGLKEIAYSLIPKDPKNPSDFWILNEQRYLHAALYYCYDMGLSFLESCRTIHSLSSADLLERIKESNCAFAKAGMSDFFGMAAETLGGITAGVGNVISIFATEAEVMKVLTKREKITPELLLDGERIYVCIPEHKLDVYRELLQLVISQFSRYFERLKDDEVRPVLFVLDEFARLGKYEIFINGLATLRSKRVTIVILTQSVSQLDALYGHDNRKVILDNCAYKVVLNASDPDSQQYFSKLAGNYMKHRKSYTRGRSSSYSISEHEEPIIRPEKLATLKKAMLISPYGLQWVQKSPYYKK